MLLACAAAVLWLGRPAAHEGHDDGHSAMDTLEVEAGDSTFAALRGGEFPLQIDLKVTGMRFRLEATGSGVVAPDGDDLYEAVLYIDETVEPGGDPAARVLEGGFAKHIRLRFLRDIGGRDLVAHVQRVLADSDVPGNMRSYFLVYMNEGIAATGTLDFFWIPGHGLHTRVGDHWHPIIQSRRLADALFALWLGDQHASDALRKDLFRLTGEGG
jgi:hypothetical protein